MRSSILRAILIAATLAGVPFAQTQQATKPKAPQASQSASQPSPEMQSLIKALSGKWSLAVQSAGSAMPAKGEETWRPGPGGLTFVEEETLRFQVTTYFSWASFGGTATLKVFMAWSAITDSPMCAI